tara:strand:- start:5246 stop:6214 length:969 start_codon:yes stop_codon:yes gene_type:complete
MWGAGVVSSLSSRPQLSKDDFISSGNIGIDLKILGGGFAVGKIAEVFGPEGSGKTTLALQAVAATIKRGKKVLYFDMEYGINPDYACSFSQRVGMSEEAFGGLFHIVYPKDGDMVFAMLSKYLESAEEDNIGLMVIDSVAAMYPKANDDTNRMAEKARMMSQGMEMLSNRLTKFQPKCTILFINQIRMKIGVSFGSPETTTGGRALPFYAAQRIDIRRIGSLKKGDEIIGNRVKIKAIKNRYSPPYRQHEVDLIFGHGFDRVAEVLDMALENGLVHKTGSWFKFGDKTVQGRDSACRYLRENEEMLASIQSSIEDLYAKTSE